MNKIIRNTFSTTPSTNASASGLTRETMNKYLQQVSLCYFFCLIKSEG